ncbi:hypothetical protein SPHINGO8BC_51048 [Sphingobacterium multivorum]|uniref:Uncharacterized protein n=1 Tax=Sphingobacterium multivorum TaxID=28454 RepID=A0A654CM89_SPHMU|nr:hypothetical protein SPHINGO8BC_51048 [Sphingobacterium multivorum]
MRLVTSSMLFSNADAKNQVSIQKVPDDLNSSDITFSPLIILETTNPPLYESITLSLL